jgi:hypothetical protein
MIHSMNDVVPATARATALTPRTYDEAVQFAEMMASSTMVPQEYRGKPANILLALQLGAELGLSPLQAVQSIATVNGRPSVYGDAALALVRASPVCDDIIETFDGTGEDAVAICTAKRRGKAPVVGRFSVRDAKRAHLWGKQGPWSQYPRRMMQMRARSFALRDAFPDVLRGLIVSEEAHDYPREAIDVTPRDTRPDLDAFAGVIDAPQLDPIPQPPAPLSEAAEQPRAEPVSSPDAAAPARGDTIPDMLGGEARPAPVRWRMPRDPSARDWQKFADWIDAQISDGVSGGALRSDNLAALEALKRHDPFAYDGVQERLTAAR